MPTAQKLVDKKKKKQASKEEKKISLYSIGNLFRKDKNKLNIPKYEDYNTDCDEDLDITPGWMKDPLGNKKTILNTDLEKLYPLPGYIKKIPLIYG